MGEKPNIVIIGSINMDLVIETDIFPKKGETIIGSRFTQNPGGKGANQAVAAARLGARVSMIGCVGSDLFGETLIDRLKTEGICTEGIKIAKDYSTGVAQVTVSENDNSIVVIPGANYCLTIEWIKQNYHILQHADIIVSQLEIPINVIQYVAEEAKKQAIPFLLNPAPAQPLPETLLKNVSYLTPNETEYALLSGDKDLQVREELPLNSLLSQVEKALFVTIGEHGVLFYSKDPLLSGSVPGHKVNVKDTTGAGDCFNGALAVSLAEGLPIGEALTVAVKSSALSVTKFGAQQGMPTKSEIDIYFQSQF